MLFCMLTRSKKREVSTRERTLSLEYVMLYYRRIRLIDLLTAEQNLFASVPRKYSLTFSHSYPISG